MSLFVSAPSKISVKLQTKLIRDPVIYRNFKTDPNAIYFVFEKPYTEKDLKSFKLFLTNKFPSLHYAFISSLLVNPSKKDMKSSIVKFYKSNRTILENIIPPFSKVISIGRALFSITLSDDIYPEDFVDEITFKNSFYSPDLKSEVFPIPFIDSWLKKDNFDRIFAMSQIKKCEAHIIEKKRIRPHTHYRVEDTSKFFKDNMKKEILAFDIETDGFDWRNGRIGDVTIAFNNYEGYHMFWKDIKIKELSDFLKDKKLIMQNGKFDSKFIIRKGVDLNSIFLIDIWNMQHVWKEDNKHNSLKSGAWRLTNFGGYDRALDDYRLKHKIKSYIDDIPDKLRIPYAIDDAIVTFDIYEKLTDLFKWVDKEYPLNNGWGITRYFNESVVPAVNTFLDVELRGLDINYEELNELSIILKKEIEEIEDQVYKAFKKDKKTFNIYSTDQLAILIENLGWEIVERGKKELPLTNETCLIRWEAQGHKEASLLLKLREKDALMKTFIGEENKNNGFFQYIVKEKDKYKVYPTIQPMLAGSGRSKHRTPNTANIPAKGNNAKFVRRMFQPPSKDYVFLSADAAGLQLRLGAVASGDEVMKDIFINKGGDMHLMTCHRVFGNILSFKEEKDGSFEIIKGKKEGYSPLAFKDFERFKKKSKLIKEYRFRSKGINFSCEFGAKSSTVKIQSIDPVWDLEACKDYIKLNSLESRVAYFKMRLSSVYSNSQDLELHSSTMTIAEDIRTKFFDTYKGLNSWIINTRVLAQKQGFIQSDYGAFRRLPYLLYQGADSDHRLISNLLNICLNTKIQNHESVMMNRLMGETLNFIKENKMKSYFIGQIHDAIEMIVYKPELKILVPFIKKAFSKGRPEYKGIPFELEGNVADYFGSEKEEVWDFGHDWNKYTATN